MTDLAKIAERNLRTYLGGVPFRNEVDREAALACVDVLVANPSPQAAGGEPVAWQYDYTDEHGVPQRDFTTGPFLASWVSAKKAKAMPLYEHPPAVGQEWEKVVRAWRNRFISERTGYYQAQGQCYEEAIASAEYDANCYADGLVKAGIAAAPAQPTGDNQ